MLEQKVLQSCSLAVFQIVVIVVILDDGRRHPAEGFLELELARFSEESLSDLAM